MPVFTDDYIKQISDDKSGVVITDEHRHAPKGFGIRVGKTSKAFVLRYTQRGKTKQYTIGEYPVWSLAAARKEAARLRADVDKGIDILAVRKRGALLDEVGACKDEGIPLEEAFKHYKQSHIDTLKSGKKVWDVIKMHFLDAMVPTELGEERLGDRPITSIRRGEVIQVIERLAKKAPRQAAIVLTYAKAMMAWAEVRELMPVNPIGGLRPKHISSSMVQKKKDRVLDHNEIRGFWFNVETCGMERITALTLKEILLTGQRPGEVAGMSEAELNGRTWDIPGARRKRSIPHSIYLADMAWETVERARSEVKRLYKRREGRKPSGYIFEAREGKAITTNALNKAVTRFARDLKMNSKVRRWTPHDLRRTCRTGLAACGVPREIAEIVIGHTVGGIVSVYDRHEYANEIRIALARWERYLGLILNSKKGSKADLRLPTSWAEDLVKG